MTTKTTARQAAELPRNQILAGDCIEIMNSLGNWAIGFIVLTLLLKGAIGILTGEVRLGNREKAARESAASSSSERTGYADA